MFLIHSPSLNFILSLNLSSSISPRLGLSLILIVNETDRAEAKKEKQKKKQKQIIKRRNERKTLNSTAPMLLRNCLGDVPCCLCLMVFVLNSSGTEIVGTEMTALVASWGLLLHDEGAWGVVEGCRGFFGGQFGGSRVPKKKF